MKKGIGQEDRMHIQFGLLLRQYEGYGKLNAIQWTYIASGEKRNLSTASMLKKKGVRSGFPDYVFFTFNKVKFRTDIIFMEFKTDIGKQQKSQKDFELSFSGAPNVCYHLVRSVEEAIKILEEEQILITD